MTKKDAGADTHHGPAQSRGAARIGTIVRHNLVAIGTAAVLTVYTAGYARTRDAARRFAEADLAARRPIAPGRPVVDSASAQPSDVNETPTPTPVTEKPVAVTVPTPPPPSGSASAPTSATSVDSAPAKEPQRDSTPVAPTEPAVTPLTQATDTTTTPPAADTAAKHPLLKDGEYYGWGTSRHGDIQAGIEIKGGRISGAWVQQCLTRYSCSWIAALPGQVVARQSPEVDYVSGATQSTNAFYYAVVEALARAK
jgi:uncharacterized protein with FMN-binding domain